MPDGAHGISGEEGGAGNRAGARDHDPEAPPGAKLHIGDAERPAPAGDPSTLSSGMSRVRTFLLRILGDGDTGTGSGFMGSRLVVNLNGIEAGQLKSGGGGYM